MKIDEFYDKYVKNELDKLYNLQSTEMSYENKFLKSFGIVLSLCIIVANILNDIFDSTFITACICISMLVFPLIFIVKSSKNISFLEYFKKNILGPFFNSCFVDLKYQYNNTFTKKELKKISGIMSEKCKIYFNDFLTLNFNNKLLELCDITSEQENRTDYPTFRLFQRRRMPLPKYELLIKIPINNFNHTSFVINHKKYIPKNSDILYYVSDKIELKLMEYNKYKENSEYYPDFNEKFNLYNYSKKPLKYKEKIIETIMYIQNKHNINLKLQVYENYLYLNIDGKQIFNDTYYSKKDFKEIVPKLFYDLQDRITEIKDIIKSCLELEKLL